jgi:cytoskeletal protein RodZ
VATPSQASTSPSLSAVVTTPGATATSGAASTPAAGSPADGRDTVPPAVDTATATVSAASAAPLTLQIRATGDVWIDASADSERKAYRLYTAGDEIRVEAQQQIHLVVGDAANVTLSINGMPAKPLGGAGIVRDLTISADSYRSLLP